MAKPNIGRFKYPQSLAQLARGRGYNSELVGFLLPFARQDFIYIEDDFAGALNADLWTLGTDAGSTAFVAGTKENGVITGVTENSSGDYILIKHAMVMWNATRNPGCEIREKRDVVITQKWEFGFSDPLTDDTLPAVNDIDTPSITNGSTDVALFSQATDQTLTTLAAVADGTTGATAKTNLDTSFIPVAATYNRMLVQLLGANQSMFVWDNKFDQATVVGQGPDADLLVRPHYILGTLASTAITVDIDYIRMWAERV